MEMILIGSTAYLKLGDKWQKAALPKGIDLSLADPKKLETEMGTTTDIKFVGSEVLDGTPTWVYQYTTNIKGPPALKMSSKSWIGIADNLPRKTEQESKPGQKTTVTFYDYNANITINAPI
jgi:outer membrane lipoprotein-sorting protein